MSEVTTLRFSGPSADAAKHLLDNTSLGHLRQYPISTGTEGDEFVVCYSEDQWRYSSGEHVLLRILGYLRYPPAVAYADDLARVDEQTAAVVREAVRLANGRAA